MEEADKRETEKKLLEEQIKKIKEDIDNEIKAQQELSGRIKSLENPTSRQKEVDEVYKKNYTSKLNQFQNMFEKMKYLKTKLEEAKS